MQVGRLFFLALHLRVERGCCRQASKMAPSFDNLVIRQFCDHHRRIDCVLRIGNCLEWPGVAQAVCFSFNDDLSGKLWKRVR